MSIIILSLFSIHSLQKCIISYFPTSSVPKGCTMCNEDGTECALCSTSLYYKPTAWGGLCFCDNDQNYYEDYNDNQCKIAKTNCYNGCEKCLQYNYEICVKCNETAHYTEKYLENGQINCVCQDRYIEKNGECVCDNENLYYQYRNTCEEVTNENCGSHCKYCFKKEKSRCAECDSENHFTVNINGNCECDYEHDFTYDSVNDTCICIKDYGLYQGKCEKLDYKYCKEGCNACRYYDHSTCIECKPNFVLFNQTDCICEEGYALIQNSNENDYRCVKAFPTECPIGCNCNEEFICQSCQEDFITEYEEDMITIKSCIQTFSCPTEKQKSCKRCNSTGECLICNENYVLVPDMKECIEIDNSIECKVDACIQCDKEDKYYCLACPPGFEVSKYHNSCNFDYAKPLTISYKELDNSIIEKGENNDIKINLNNIDQKLLRPYFYVVNDDIEKIEIENIPSLNFQIRFPDETRWKSLSIVSKDSNSNPRYSIRIKCYDIITLNLESKNAEIYGYGNITLVSNKETIELSKLTVFQPTQSREFLIYHNKNVTFNEIDFYLRESDLIFIPNDDEQKSKVFAKNVKLQQKISAIVNHIQIENLYAAPSSSLKSQMVSVENIEINILEANPYAGSTVLIGNITGVPKSIKINRVSVNKLLDDHIYVKSDINVAEGYNEEFFQNCEEWAKIYNDNPTDDIFNQAFCIDKTDYMELSINHKYVNDEPNGSDIGIIIGIVVGCVVVVALIIFLLVYFLVIKKRRNKNQSLSEKEAEEV